MECDSRNLTKLNPISQGTIKVVKEGHSPYIGDNGNWFVYDDTQKKSVDTGIKAQGPEGIQGEKGENGITGQVFYWVTPDDKDGPLSIMYDAFHEVYQNGDSPPLSPYLFLICKEDGVYSWDTKFNRECKALDVLIMEFSDCARYTKVRYGYSLKGEKGEDGKGAISDWEQTDENADDYIKNKPFYDKSEVYTFPNADYETPAFLIDGDVFYKICEGLPPIDDYNGIIMNYHIKDTALQYRIKIDGIEQTEMSANFDFGITILFFPVPISETITVPIGIYAFPVENKLAVLDSFVKENITRIDKKFIPEPNALIYDTTVFNIADASYLFTGSTFIKPPFKIKSNNYLGAFNKCSRMEECTVLYNGAINVNYHFTFSGCEQLKVIKGNISHPEFDNSTFEYCNSLTDIEQIDGVKTNMKLPHSTKLSNITVTKIFKALVASETKHILVLPSNIIDGLTDEQLALVPSNWTIQ